MGKNNLHFTLFFPFTIYFPGLDNVNSDRDESREEH